jgi:hypothetical protein
MDDKKASLLKMFACYPSAILASKDQAAMMLAAYLEKLQSVSADAVESACSILSSRNEPFPPSAGQVFDKAREIEHRRAKADAESVPRIRYVAPFEQLTEEERERNKRKLSELLNEIRASNVA